MSCACPTRAGAEGASSPAERGGWEWGPAREAMEEQPERVWRQNAAPPVLFWHVPHCCKADGGASGGAAEEEDAWIRAAHRGEGTGVGEDVYLSASALGGRGESPEAYWALAAIFVVCALFLTSGVLGAWLKHQQPLRSRDQAHLIVHNGIVFLAQLFVTIVVTGEFLAPCALQLWLFPLWLAMAWYELLKTAQFAFLFTWNSLRAKSESPQQPTADGGPGRVRIDGNPPWVTKFFVGWLNYTVESRVYYLGLAAIALFAFATVLWQGTDSSLASASGNAFDGAVRCWWWQIPARDQVARNDSSAVCQCLASMEADSALDDLHDCTDAVTETCAEWAATSAVPPLGDRTELRDLCLCMADADRGNVSCILQSEFMPNYWGTGACGWIAQAVDMSTCQACGNANHAAHTLNLSVLLLLLSALVVMAVFVRAMDDKLTMRTETMSFLFVSAPIMLLSQLPSLSASAQDSFDAVDGGDAPDRFANSLLFATPMAVWFTTTAVPISVALWWKWYPQWVAFRRGDGVGLRSSMGARPSIGGRPSIGRGGGGGGRPVQLQAQVLTPAMEVLGIALDDMTVSEAELELVFAIENDAAGSIFQTFSWKEFTVENYKFLKAIRLMHMRVNVESIIPDDDDDDDDQHAIEEEILAEHRARGSIDSPTSAADGTMNASARRQTNRGSISKWIGQANVWSFAAAGGRGAAVEAEAVPQLHTPLLGHMNYLLDTFIKASSPMELNISSAFRHKAQATVVGAIDKLRRAKEDERRYHDEQTRTMAPTATQGEPTVASMTMVATTGTRTVTLTSTVRTLTPEEEAEEHEMGVDGDADAGAGGAGAASAASAASRDAAAAAAMADDDEDDGSTGRNAHGGGTNSRPLSRRDPTDSGKLTPPPMSSRKRAVPGTAGARRTSSTRGSEKRGGGMATALGAHARAPASGTTSISPSSSLGQALNRRRPAELSVAGGDDLGDVELSELPSPRTAKMMAAEIAEAMLSELQPIVAEVKQMILTNTWPRFRLTPQFEDFLKLSHQTDDNFEDSAVDRLGMTYNEHDADEGEADVDIVSPRSVPVPARKGMMSPTAAAAMNAAPVDGNALPRRVSRGATNFLHSFIPALTLSGQQLQSKDNGKAPDCSQPAPRRKSLPAFAGATGHAQQADSERSLEPPASSRVANPTHVRFLSNRRVRLAAGASASDRVDSRQQHTSRLQPDDSGTR